MRKLIFMGNSLDSLSKFPDEVKREIGYALRFAQNGKTHDKAKPFKGYHAFHKKSKHGIKTPKPDLEVIETRYKAAKRMEEDYV